MPALYGIIGYPLSHSFSPAYFRKKFAELHSRVKRESFGLTLDLGHLVCQSELPIGQHIREWKDWLWNVHIEDMKAGETITAQNVRAIRPGFGLPPKHYESLMGRAVKADVTRGTPVSWDSLA